MAAFSRLRLSRDLLRTLRSGNFAHPATVRTTTVPPTLSNHSMLNSTPANANGATTCLLPTLRRLLSFPHGGSNPPHVLVLAPAHRLTVRITSRTHRLTGRARLSVTAVANNMTCVGRTRIFDRGRSVIITAAKHLLRCVGRRGFSYHTIRALVLSRTSHVLSVNFTRSVRRVTNRAH